MKILLKKMRTSLVQSGAKYELVNSNSSLDLNALIGKRIQLRHTGNYFCINHHGPIKKTFGEGLCWKCFNEAAVSSPCIIHPELCRIHEGIALRGDLQWERENHLQEHAVYISHTSGIKVGVTRLVNVHSRWIDQGARRAIILARVPYRQLAGEIEVFLKEHIADKTNWKQMLVQGNAINDLTQQREIAIEMLPEQYQDFVDFESQEVTIHYPVVEPATNPRTLKLEIAEYSGVLKGIVGQYFLLENNLVFNIRGNSGMEIELITED